MKERISELLDGELNDEEARRRIAALKADGELRQTWDTYHLIGDAIRGHLALDVSAKVAARLADEPTVVAPARRAPERQRLRNWSLPAAAAVAAVAVVAWIAQGMLAPPPQLAQKPQAPMAAQPASVASAVPASGVANYLLAHQRYSATSAMQGVAPYVRTVSHEPQSSK
ncbi:MAG: hypothetical protein A3I01_02170 [Betaproteobacteria bacterium RIFCSPLOWO2_02_FULL_65_24]|nr:MAG: hypothetical protein A3I01_02170 [Betaproteobacteria bacterium RIFCSPLOWO2_02_FULL_65_24]